MSNEATIQSSLIIRSGKLDYRSQPGSFQADVSTAKGPTPGAITVSTAGTDVDLSELANPSLVRVMNLDNANYVEWGVHDGTTFHPVGEMLPGESYVFRFSRNLGEEETVAGTGTTAVIHAFHMRANAAACVCLVEAFEQ